MSTTGPLPHQPRHDRVDTKGPSMRVAPRPWIGVAIWAGYVALILTVTLLGGVPYPDIGTTADNTWRGAVFSLAAGAILVAVLTSVFGWWRPALTEQKRSRRKWPLVVPLLMVTIAVLNLVNTDWSQFDTSFLLSLIALGVLVGFSEELLARGLILTAFRAQFSEGWAWFASSALFGLMHIANAIIGAPLVASLEQAAVAFASGTALYILRRVTGSLIWAMLLHGLWDVATFSVGHAPLGLQLAVVLAPVVGIAALIVVHWVIKDTNETPHRTRTTAS